YWREGFLTGPLATASALMLVPTLLGMTLGAKVRGRLSEPAFKQILLVVFVVIGLNLIRRAITG
ncbi:MAG: sulfite exporter TauE/SafE family protein, partial [Silicimonas sp.]|nr:sulfite exporter TauE/SafE family protein [Silicimonas sp.]